MGQIILKVTEATDARMYPPNQIQPNKLYHLRLRGGANGPFAASRERNGSVELTVPQGITQQDIEALVELPPVKRIYVEGGPEQQNPSPAEAFDFMVQHAAGNVTVEL